MNKRFTHLFPLKYAPLFFLFTAALVVVGLWLAFDVKLFKAHGDAEPVQAELRKMVERVGSHVLPPAGEDPTLATVTDVGALAGQAFFARARVGDALLIFPKAKIVILYDPERDRVLNVAPLAENGAIAGTSTVPAASGVSPPPPPRP